MMFDGVGDACNLAVAFFFFCLMEVWALSGERISRSCVRVGCYNSVLCVGKQGKKVEEYYRK